MLEPGKVRKEMIALQRHFMVRPIPTYLSFTSPFHPSNKNRTNATT